MSAEQIGATSRGVTTALWSHKRVWLLHVGGNLALLALAYAWLWIPDEKAWQVAGSALAGLAIAAGTLWLHGATMEFFGQVHGGEEGRILSTFRATLRRVPALGVWLIFVLLILWLLGRAEDHIPGWASWLASWLTMIRRRPITPLAVQKVLFVAAWLLNWFVVPLVVLPVAVQVAADGFAAFGVQGLRRSFNVIWRRRYWLGYAIYLVLGAYGAYRFVGWVPKAHGIRLEFASAALRLLVAYLLAVTAWLALLSFLAGLARDSDVRPATEP